MKTILHISKYYYPDHGGIESVARFLAENLKDFKNEVICFATDKALGVNYISGVAIHRVPVQFSVMSQAVAFGYYAQLKALIARIRPDIVVLHCPNPYLYPIVIRLISPSTKLVVLWHSDILAKGIVYRLIRPLETQLLRRADHIIATSQAYIDYSEPLREFTHKTIVLQNTVNTQMFDLRNGDEGRIANIRRLYGGKKIVLFVGRHIKYKGIDRLIAAEKLVQGDCVFVIAGTGPLTGSLQRQAAGRDRIHFIGRLSDDDLRCHLYAAHIFAFPSTYKAEAFGVALAEAMYCGAVPVTFTIRGSGVNFVSINGITGEEAPAGDVKAYAAAIDRLLSDDVLHEKYSAAARQRIDNIFKDTRIAATANNIFLTI